MDHTQGKQLERALVRARKGGIEVTGKGTRKCDGAAVYTVSSKSQPGRWHLVAVTSLHLVCDCQAGRRGMICQHRALVQERLAAEPITVEVLAARSPSTRNSTSPAQERERAILRRSQRPFSLLK